MFKYIIGSIVAVVAAISSWCYHKWDVWFNNGTEKAYSVCCTPDRLMLTPSDSSSTSRNVSWLCDTIVRPSHLLLVDKASSDTSVVCAEGEVYASRAGRAAYYVCRLRNLIAGHSYSYCAVTGNASSKWHSFSIPDAPDECTFLYLGDIQDTIGGIMHSVIDTIISRQPHFDLLALGGDLVQEAADNFWQEAMYDIDSIRQTTPVINIPGNHEYFKGLPVSLERRFSLVFSYFLDSEIGHDEDSPWSGSQVFTTTLANVQFFCLDGNRELPYLISQRSWLEEQLQQSTARWKIVLIHQPLFSIRNSNNNLIQRYVFADLLSEYGVDLVLQAHEHAYSRYFEASSDTLLSPVYTISHCSRKHYHIEFDDRFHKFGCGDYYYQMIHASADSLVMSTYRIANDSTLATSLYDALTLVKTTPSQQHATIIDNGSAIKETVFNADHPAGVKFEARIDNYKKSHPERFQ